ncbi:hypothetical protein FSP39_004274 [Pinctada imbricata]|uniref:Uncharacterized protein n=1 Tax=Pinctada imbricata TaxID=66713 RepID=A0AA88XVK6_PINIB|nr:hypothetical protein FSP39_004274 [Pinctada imbricata]
MKRCVTFDELSIGFSTISKSLDDIERVSNSEESIRGCDNNKEQEPEIHTIILDDGEEAPEYIDNFADDAFAVPIPPKIPKKSEKRECSLTEADIERCHQQSCEICKGFMDERQRIQRYFGGIESFLDWLFSKWGKSKKRVQKSIVVRDFLVLCIDTAKFFQSPILYRSV